MREPVHAPGGAAPKGPYSQGIATSGRLLFVAAQGPIDPKTGEVIAGTFEQQALQAFENVRAVVESARGRMADVVRVTVYMREWDMETLDTVWRRVFAPPYPVPTPVKTETPIGSILVEVTAALPG
ncbi:MAG: RidA family protein [Thermoanaerobaculia bacterium]